MDTAKDLLSYFIDMYKKDGGIENLSETSVNKLVYFTYAWYAAGEEKELFPMEAWKYGPIQSTSTHEEIKAIKLGTKNNFDYKLSPTLLEYAEDVYLEYGKYDKDELYFITHNEPAFKMVEERVKSGEDHVMIDFNIVKDYYKSLMILS